MPVRSASTPAPFSSFRTVHNSSRHPVTSKLYQLEKKTGSCKCKIQRCLTCKNVQECDFFCVLLKNILKLIIILIAIVNA